MEQHAKEGKYVLAENCRVNAEKLKKELDSKRVTEVEKRQKKENMDVKKYLKEELTTFAQ
jgi:translation initiation factor 2 alpha subunit (eIF-2alpha)